MSGRALTTEYERECLRGENGEQRMYEARSKVRARIKNQLTEDVELFERHAGGLLDELRETVCE